MPPVDPEAVARRAGPPSTTDEIRNRMRACSAGADTAPELALRRELRARGRTGYRVNPSIELPGRRAVRPDLAWIGRRVAVFVDGCFWHCCPEHYRPPKTNLDYWLPKLQRNVERDAIQTALLEAAGWTVLRAWEHQDPGLVAGLVEHLLDA